MTYDNPEPFTQFIEAHGLITYENRRFLLLDKAHLVEYYRSGAM